MAQASRSEFSWKLALSHLLAAVLTWLVVSALSSVFHVANVNLFLEPVKPNSGGLGFYAGFTFTVLYATLVALAVGVIIAPLVLVAGLPIWYLGFRLLRDKPWPNAKKAAWIAGPAWSPVLFVYAAISTTESNHLWSWYLCAAISVLIVAPAIAWVTHAKEV